MCKDVDSHFMLLNQLSKYSTMLISDVEAKYKSKSHAEILPRPHNPE